MRFLAIRMSDDSSKVFLSTTIHNFFCKAAKIVSTKNLKTNTSYSKTNKAYISGFHTTALQYTVKRA